LREFGFGVERRRSGGKVFFLSRLEKLVSTDLDLFRKEKKRQKQRSYYSISTNMVIYLRAELGYMPDKAALVVRRRRGFLLIIL
jgi:hypothetical protein